MTTTFSSLPVVDVGPLGAVSGATPEELVGLSKRLYEVFATTGFAYLTNVPLSYDHAEVFNMSREFFALPQEEKMKLAKKSFRREHKNTYRGSIPLHLLPKLASDNLKEGFEMGPATPISTQSGMSPSTKFNLAEPNVWPDKNQFRSRSKLETLYIELQILASKLLSLLAMSLGKPANYFAPYLEDSLSTLRLLHYPPVASTASGSGSTKPGEVNLSCTPHTDSGILTLLHQDSTGGLEVRNSSGEWVAAPYVPGSLVVNIGDLMAKVSGGRFVATMHRVRAPGLSSSASTITGHADWQIQASGRMSVPFFFEPGENCLVRSVDGDEGFVRYGEHVRAKMKTWVEFQDDEDN
ncbi:Gibberellin 20-oxidase [Penicillium macrosclerotiorum]|uniref:Gibberellin 20-oxidase n=1 Tax=Penicillium macrosclerotiorum TaxID=303699 RepID=UPI00254854BF|nr:Gibberellin 20-oxidase [Penicillium macrosclerotiorum]KAJ5683473.1 Gibberellin 20-oxidase [Penicillium macrosclerotiorum]